MKKLVGDHVDELIKELQMEIARTGLLTEEVLDEFERFLATYPEASVQRDFADIGKRARRALFESNYGREVGEALRKLICDRRPTSLIRLGDGEGNVLASLDCGEYEVLYALGTHRLLDLMFGGRKFSKPEIEEITVGLRRAVLDADILAIPDTARISFCHKGATAQLAAGRDTVDVRGVVGTLNAVRLTRHLLQAGGRVPDLVTNCYVHVQLMDAYPDVLHGLPFLGIISCYHDIGELLRRRFAIDGDVIVYNIPEQAVNIGRQPDIEHFPTVYNRVLHDLDVPFSGAVFLVAAGILGKIYCSHIKSKGGIAIDIGSVADVWVGKGTRPYHSDHHLARWKLT